jgi:hypothetical protein
MKIQFVAIGVLLSSASALASTTVSSPASGGIVTSPVKVVASSNDSGVTNLQVWEGNTKYGAVNGSSLSQTYTMSEGTHSITVLSGGVNNKVLSSKVVSFTVGAPGALTVSSPAQNSTESTQVNFVANSTYSGTANLQVWEGNTKYGAENGTSLNQTYSMSVGSHSTTVIAVGSNNQTLGSKIVSFTVGSGAALNVTSPAQNSTTTSTQVSFVASSSYSGTENIQVWEGSTKYGAETGTSLKQTYTMSAGSHSVTVEAVGANNDVLGTVVVKFTVGSGGGGGGSGFDGSSNIPNPPSSANHSVGIDNLSGWSSATGAASSCPNGVPSSTCNPPNANYNPTPAHVADPAYLSGSDNSSGLFEMYQSPAYATAIWGHSLFTATTAVNFIWDFYMYVNSTNYGASELDLYTTLNNGQRFMMGSQCNRGANSWDTWSEASQHWIHNPSIPCNALLSADSWHHVTFYSTVDAANNTYTYHVIRIDGVDYVLNQTQSTEYVGWPEGLVGVQVQLDINSTGAPVNEYIESMQLYGW